MRFVGRSAFGHLLVVDEIHVQLAEFAIL
jgi:hypothetical protein